MVYHELAVGQHMPREDHECVAGMGSRKLRDQKCWEEALLFSWSRR
jgi:hypothetical protein